MSLFITFEGGEGCGKSLQARILYRKFVRLAIPALLTREPGGTSLGNRVSRLLKWARDTDISPLTELLLFNGSRSQLVTEVLKPNLKNGIIVICDRYADSTVAYQGYGRGLDLGIVRAINDSAVQGLTPDQTFLLDIPVETGLRRKNTANPDRFERENLAFHQRVREGYLKLAADEPGRWLVINAAKSKEIIARIIWRRVSQVLSTREGR